MKALRLSGILPTNPAAQALSKLRGALMGKLGFRAPRTTSAILKLVGLSPGTITTWFDVEGGWLSEARVKEGAPPIYHWIDEQTAMTILKGELTHELEDRLMTPNVYVGE